MINAATLRTYTVKDLAAMAKKKGVPGWHSMRKDALVKALLKTAKSEAAKSEASKGKSNGCSTSNGCSKKPAARRPATNGVASTNGHAKNGKAHNGVLSNGVASNNGHSHNGVSHNGTASKNGKASRNGDGRVKTLTPYAERRLRLIKARLAESKDLALKAENDGQEVNKDRLVLMVRDPYWLHVYWELTRTTIDRARAALGQYWHGAQPTLRLFTLPKSSTTNTTREHERDIEVHGGVNNWYIDVQNPPRTFQIDLGYVLTDGRFFSLVRSNVVTTPRAGAKDSFDNNWAEVAKDFDRVYAMSGGYTEQEANGDLKEVFEERLRRPMGDPMATQFGMGAGGDRREFNFEIDAELIVHGVTDPDARVTLKGEPVHLREDGTFAVRFNLPDRRHVLPVVASSSDGVEQRTIVLAVDRNTKVMEPVVRDAGE